MTATASLPLTPFYVTGGTLPPHALSYVERKADTDLTQALRDGEFCYVLNARQMGKSSLCVQTRERLKADGVRAVFCDLTRSGSANVTVEQWYASLLANIGRELGRQKEFLLYWKANPEVTPVQRLFDAILEIGLSSGDSLSDSPIVLFVDEIDVTLSLPFSADEFFVAIRQCYVGRATDERLNRLAICLLGTASPADLIQDAKITPFNIGKRIELRDFTPQEAAPLAAGLAKHGDGAKLLERVLYWTAGHPYLTQRLCAALVTAAPDTGHQTPHEVDKLCNELFLAPSAKEKDSNLPFVQNELLRREGELPALLSLYRQVRAGKRVKDDETNTLCSILKLSGVAKSVDGELRVRNRIYAQVFDAKWIESHMPDAEKRRQQKAYRKGLGNAFGVASALIGILLGLIIPLKAALTEARQQREKAERTLYISKMNLVQREYENNNVGRTLDLLEETRNSKYRGFEWGYLNRMCHLELFTFRGQKTYTDSVAFSPDGKRIFIGSFDGTAKFWDAQTGQELFTQKSSAIVSRSVAFSSDGKRIITSSDDGTVKICEAQTGKVTLTLKGHKDQLFEVAFSPDGKRIVTRSRDKTAKIWDAQTGKELVALKGHSDKVTSFAFSPDGKRILMGSNDGTAKVWYTETGQEILTLKGYSGTVYSVAFSPNGKRIVTGGEEGTAKVWDAVTGQETLTLKGHSGGVYSVKFSLDGKHILTSSFDGTGKVWDATLSYETLNTKKSGREGDLRRFSPDGKHIVTFSADKTTEVRDAKTNNTIFSQKGVEGSVAFSPDSKSVVTGCEDGTAKVWDAETGRKNFTLKVSKTPVLCVAFSPDSKRILTQSQIDNSLKFRDMIKTSELTNSREGKVKIWDAATGQELFTLKYAFAGSSSFTFSPDGIRIITNEAFGDASAKVWDVKTGKELVTLKGPSGTVLSVTFSPDGKRILTGSNDGTAKIWDAETGQEIFTLKGYSGSVYSVAFSHDGKRIVTGNRNGRVKVWDTDTGQEILTLKGHSGVVFSVIFSPDGKRILTASEDGTAKVWFSDIEDANTVFNRK